MPASSVQSLFLIAAICLAIGCAFGWLVASLRGGQNENKPVSPAEKPAGEDEPRPSLLRLMRDPIKGSLIVGLGEKTRADAVDLTLEERKQLVDLLHETMTWAGIPSQAEASAAVPLPPGAAATPPGRTTGPLDPKTVQGSSAETPRPTVLGGMTNALADVLSPAPAKKDEPKSIVQQIDEILQDKLLGTELEGQKIGLVEDLRKGVVVRVGSETYEGIGSVPEGLVKNLLRASVQEWEKRQEIAKRRNAL